MPYWLACLCWRSFSLSNTIFGEAHADDGPDDHIVECDICTIASGAVDNAPAIGSAETPTIRPSELPSQTMEVARQGADRPGGPRAPPQTH